MSPFSLSTSVSLMRESLSPLHIKRTRERESLWRETASLRDVMCAHMFFEAYRIGVKRDAALNWKINSAPATHPA